MNTITHDIFVTVVPSKNFCKQMQRQARSMKMFKLIAVGAMALAAATEVERRKLEEQVYQLSVRVKKLERSEGEYTKRKGDLSCTIRSHLAIRTHGTIGGLSPLPVRYSIHLRKR